MKAARAAATPTTDEARATSDMASFVEELDAAPVWLMSEAVEVADPEVGFWVTTMLVRETEELEYFQVIRLGLPKGA